MKGWGITSLLIGIGAFILPMFGIQFILVSVFGEYELLAAIGYIVVGIGLLVAGLVTESGGAQA